MKTTDYCPPKVEVTLREMHLGENMYVKNETNSTLLCKRKV